MIYNINADESSIVSVTKVSLSAGWDEYRFVPRYEGEHVSPISISSEDETNTGPKADWMVVLQHGALHRLREVVAKEMLLRAVFQNGLDENRLV